MAAGMCERLDLAERALVRFDLDEAVQIAEEVMGSEDPSLRLAATAVAVQGLARKECWMQVRPLMERIFGSFGETPMDVFLLWATVELAFERYSEVEGLAFLYLKEMEKKLEGTVSSKEKVRKDYDAVALFLAEKGLFQGETKLESAEKKFLDVTPLVSESTKAKIRVHLKKNLKPPEPKSNEVSRDGAHGIMQLLNRMDRGDARHVRDMEDAHPSEEHDAKPSASTVYVEYAMSRIRSLKRMFDEAHPTVRTSIACALGAIFMYAWMQEKESTFGLVSRGRAAISRGLRSFFDLFLGNSTRHEASLRI